MKSSRRRRLRNLFIYYLKALIFSVGSYLLILVVYGGSRLSFFAWFGVVLLAFTIGYIPYLFQLVRKSDDQ